MKSLKLDILSEVSGSGEEILSRVL